MARTLFDNARVNYAATKQKRYKNSYRRRLMDRSIMDDIINGNPENVKSLLGVGKGAEVELYIPGTVKIRDTQPDGGIVYQQMTDTYETFGINYESYWALRFRPEDKAFMPFDPMSDTFTNAADMMARHIEKKFGAKVPSLVPAFNRGHEAGVTYGSYDLGTPTEPVRLFKTQRQCDAATGVRRDVAADFIVKLASTIRQNEGLSGGHVSVIFDDVVKHHLETSELKLGGLMGRNVQLGSGPRGGRSEVRFLGTLDDTITCVQDNIMFRESVTTGSVTEGSSSKTRTVHPVFAIMQDACAFVHDTIMRDDALKDAGNWDEHYRAKEVYDFPVLFPQMMALAYVTLADNDD